MLDKADIKKLIDLIVADIKLLELLKCLDALDFFQLTTAQMKHSNIFERCADVTECRYDWVI